MISTVEKVLFLKSIDLFSQIPGEDLAQVALISQEENREQGDEIFAEGEAGDALYLVVSGAIYRRRVGGRRLRVVDGAVAVRKRRRTASQQRLDDEQLHWIEVDGAPSLRPPPGKLHQSSREMSGPPLVATTWRASSAATSLALSPKNC